jgi:hypothetical protein
MEQVMSGRYTTRSMCGERRKRRASEGLGDEEGVGYPIWDDDEKVRFAQAFLPSPLSPLSRENSVLSFLSGSFYLVLFCHSVYVGSGGGVDPLYRRRSSPPLCGMTSTESSTSTIISTSLWSSHGCAHCNRFFFPSLNCYEEAMLERYPHSVVPGTNVRNIRFVLDQNLSTF